MNTNTLSPESSSASPQQQGLAGKGKKGKSGQSTTLFSRLLESLQQGSKGKKGLATKEVATADASQTKTAVPTEKNKTSTIQTSEVVNTKKAVLITSASDKKTDPSLQAQKQPNTQVATSLKSMVTHQKETLEVEAQTDVVATAQEAILVPQHVIKTGAQERSESGQLIHAKNKHGQTTTTHTNTTPRTESNLGSQPTQVQIDQPNTSKNARTNSPEQPAVHIASSSVSTRPPAELDAKAIATAAPQAKVNVNSDEPKSQLNLGNTAKTPTTRVQPEVSAQQMAKQADKADVQQQQTRVTTVETDKNVTHLKTNGANESITESKDALKTAQSPAAALQQQRNPQQSQNNNHVANAQQGNATVTTRVGDASFTSSQQDLSSNQQQAGAAMLDANQADAKASKGLDFQAQLAYKSQRTFTPADSMLEIVRSAKTGATSLELQLEPANLGKVQVSIQMDAAKQIQVMFTVDQAHSRHALEQQMPQLRLAMAQQGLDMGGFSMQMNQQGGQEAQNQTGEGLNASNSNNNTTATANNEQQTRIGVNMASHGHLSVLA